MELEIVDSFSRLENLRGEWSTLLDGIERITPFQTPEWLLTWWRHFGNGQLHVAVFRHGGEMTAIVPCLLHDWNSRRQLTLLGSGVSDYLEPPIAPKWKAEVIEILRTHLLANREWDFCDWQDLDTGSPLAALAAVQDDTPCSEIKLTGSFENYWACRGKDLRRNLRRYGERARKIGRMEFAVTCNASLIDELIRLHGTRWQKQDETGMVAANHTAEFLRNVLREFERRDILRFFTLRFRDEAVALSAGFLFRNTLYSYLSAFDPQYETLGFGRRLLYESLRYAYEYRYRTWNFCRGEEAYKFSFGADRIPKFRLKVARAAAHTA